MVWSLRNLRRHRFGVAAPRLTVRPHVAWYWRLVGLVAVLSVSLAMGMWIYDTGRRFAGYDKGEADTELASLRTRVTAFEDESVKLRSVAAVSESTLKIERSAQEKLAQQVKVLEAENGRLKEDLAFFENLSQKDRGDDRVSVYRFKVESDVMPGEYRYWLLVAQGGQRDREFQGRLQFVVTLQRDGRDAILTLPDDRPESAAGYRISFRRFYRAEGSFRIDPAAKVRAVQVRVIEQGASQPRVTESYTLS